MEFLKNFGILTLIMFLSVVVATSFVALGIGISVLIGLELGTLWSNVLIVAVVIFLMILLGLFFVCLAIAEDYRQ